MQIDLIMMQNLQAQLDHGRRLGPPDSILINGRGPNHASFHVEPGIS